MTKELRNMIFFHLGRLFVFLCQNGHHLEMISRVTLRWYHRLNATLMSKMLGDEMWKYSNVHEVDCVKLSSSIYP